MSLFLVSSYDLLQIPSTLNDSWDYQLRRTISSVTNSQISRNNRREYAAKSICWYTAAGTITCITSRRWRSPRRWNIMTSCSNRSRIRTKHTLSKTCSLTSITQWTNFGVNALSGDADQNHQRKSVAFLATDSFALHAKFLQHKKT